MTTRSHKPVIGLLGAPGSGKTWVAGQFESLGCAVIDADVLAKRQFDDPVIRDQLVGWWGRRVLDPGGRIKHDVVAGIVFNDLDQLQRLEALIHPRVLAEREELRRQYEAASAVIAVVEDVPLLLEKDLADGCDLLVFVDAPRSLRLERAQRLRGWTNEDLERREKNQMPLDKKRRRAEYVIDNRGREADTAEQVRRLLSQILREQA